MKGKIWRKILSVCLVLLMVAALVPAQLFSAGAASNTAYIYRWWDSASQQVKSETRYVEATKLQDLSADLQDLNSGWYYSQNWIEFNKRVNINGTVNIILCEEGGSYVKFKDGIHVSPGNTLNIYGQGNETQALEAFADTDDYAGIGGNGSEDCGDINIYGGLVNAKADVDAAGIGGGFKGYGGHINIYGGKIDATGGSVNTNGGAGIGGGGQGAMLKSSVVRSILTAAPQIPTAALVSAAVMKKASIISSSTAAISRHRAAVTPQVSAAATTVKAETSLYTEALTSKRPAANTARVSAAVRAKAAARSRSTADTFPLRAAITAQASAAVRKAAAAISRSMAVLSERPEATTARVSAAVIAVAAERLRSAAVQLNPTADTAVQLSAEATPEHASLSPLPTAALT